MYVVKSVFDDEFGDFFRAEFFNEFCADFVLNRFAGIFTGELAGRKQRGNETVAGELLGFVQNFVGNNVKRDFAFLPASLCHQLFLGGDNRLNGLLRVFQRGVKISFRDFPGCAFIHHDVFVVADIDEVEVALGHFRVRRVGDEFSVDATDPNCAKRSGPRNVADHQRCARANDAQNIRVVFAVRTQENSLNLHFVIPAFWKQRTNRTVGETAGKNFFFRRTAFAFEITAGKFSGGGGFFAVVNGQRKKVLAGFGFRRRDRRDDDNGFAKLDGHCAIGLFGELAGFNDNLLVAQLGGYFFGHINLPTAIRGTSVNSERFGAD